MISLIMAVYNEENLIIQTLFSIYKQIINLPDYEIIIVASGCTDSTVDLISHQKNKFKNFHLIEENKRNGKASALNIAKERVKGDICILIDGDVILGKYSIIELMKPFKNREINLSCARVIPQNPPNSLITKIAHIRCEVWHKYRISKSERGLPLIPSGYMYAIRTKYFPYVPKDIINDDLYVGLLQGDKRDKGIYSKNSLVFPIFPKTLDDYISQRTRTQLGRLQLLNDFGIQITNLQLDFMNFSKSIYKNCSNQQKLHARLNMLLELYVRSKTKFILKNHSPESFSIWDPIASTKCF